MLLSPAVRLMHTTLRWLAAVLAVAATGLAAPAHGQVPVARVHGVVIMSDTLDRRFDEYLRARNMNIQRLQRPEKVREMKREVLDALIAEELLWQQAGKDGRIASDAQVDRSLEQTRGQYKSPEQFQRSIARAGFSEPAFREHVRRMLSADAVAQAVIEARVSISDADMRTFYEANAKEFSRPEQVKTRLIAIAIPQGADEAQRRDARMRIDNVVLRLAAGEDFADLARRYSEHPTRQWGGDLDPVVRGQLPPALDRAAFSLEPGKVSPVIETAQGFHLLRVEGRIAAAVVPFEQAREQINQHLFRQRGNEALQSEVSRLRAGSQVDVLVPL